MDRPKKGASAKELQKYIDHVEAENLRLKNGGANQEKMNLGKVITVQETDEKGNILFEVDYQFTRPNFIWPKFGKVTAAQVVADQARYATYIQRMIQSKSDLITEVARRKVEEQSDDVDYSIYEGVTIPKMKEALDKAGVEYDGTQRERMDYLPLYHQVIESQKEGGE
ncbi:hypothetical protein [Roseivirga thermotolerans]|uniref:Uncharacterized protein n=1 Tax=Roseivirga thermotolerans TaxID=1758176 RepID=A0ABQ3I8Q4_9BACT|nr:hypothetical protein [Roseivirga thermotolerans]GHE64907.1 hypothetical protein GCM10011340_19890 [Roseivirga thermotolerans]